MRKVGPGKGSLLVRIGFRRFVYPRSHVTQDAVFVDWYCDGIPVESVEQAINLILALGAVEVQSIDPDQFAKQPWFDQPNPNESSARSFGRRRPGLKRNEEELLFVTLEGFSKPQITEVLHGVLLRSGQPPFPTRART